jgi:hypothetical protein
MARRKDKKIKGEEDTTNVGSDTATLTEDPPQDNEPENPAQEVHAEVATVDTINEDIKSEEIQKVDLQLTPEVKEVLEMVVLTHLGERNQMLQAQTNSAAIEAAMQHLPTEVAKLFHDYSEAQRVTDIGDLKVLGEYLGKIGGRLTTTSTDLAKVLATTKAVKDLENLRTEVKAANTNFASLSARFSAIEARMGTLEGFGPTLQTVLNTVTALNEANSKTVAFIKKMKSDLIAAGALKA